MEGERLHDVLPDHQLALSLEAGQRLRSLRVEVLHRPLTRACRVNRLTVPDREVGKVGFSRRGVHQ